MGLQDVVSNTGYELIKEVDNITKPPIKDWLMGLFNSKIQVNKIESLINKGKKERCFIQKYIETKRATFSNDSAILSFRISNLAVFAALIVAIYSMFYTEYIQQYKYLFDYIIGFLVLSYAFVFLCCIIEFIRILRGKNASEEIIVAIEDTTLWNHDEIPRATSKLDEINVPLTVNEKNWWRDVIDMKMFDINNDDMRNRKLKFIEVLLIVGGIIGAIMSGGIKSSDVYSMNTINLLFGVLFSVFILVSIIYYGLVSNKITVLYRVLGVAIASCFSIIAVWPLTQVGIALKQAEIVNFANPTWFIALIVALFVGLILLMLFTTLFVFRLLCMDEDKTK